MGKPRKNDEKIAMIDELIMQDISVKDACEIVGMSRLNYYSGKRHRCGGTAIAIEKPVSLVRHASNKDGHRVPLPKQFLKAMGIWEKEFDVRMICDGRSILILPEIKQSRAGNDTPPFSDAP